MALDNHISSRRVRIRPPAYTGLETVESRQLDLVMVEGSEVEWQLQIEGTDSLFALQFADDELLKLAPLDPDRHAGAKTIGQTGLYRVVAMRDDLSHPLDGIHTLTVERDQAPEIRFESPTETALEIPMSAAAAFDSVVSISGRLWC